MTATRASTQSLTAWRVHHPDHNNVPLASLDDATEYATEHNIDISTVDIELVYTQEFGLHDHLHENAPCTIEECTGALTLKWEYPTGVSTEGPVIRETYCCTKCGQEEKTEGVQNE